MKRSLKKSKEKIKKYLKANDNENVTTQNLWDAAKAVLRGKLMAIQSYLKKTRKTQNKQPNFPTKETGKRGGKKKLVEEKKS